MNRSEQKHQAIIEAAKQEFTTYGFVAANMNNVCQQAEVSKRTLYRHFESKERLFEEVLVEIQSTSLQTLDYLLDPQQNICEQIKQVTLLEANTIYNIYGIGLSRTIVMEFFREPELAKSITQRLHRRKALTAWFDKAINAGLLEAENGESIATIYLSLFQGLLFWPQVLDLASIPTEVELTQKAAIIAQTITRTFTPCKAY